MPARLAREVHEIVLDVHLDCWRLCHEHVTPTRAEPPPGMISVVEDVARDTLQGLVVLVVNQKWVQF